MKPYRFRNILALSDNEQICQLFDEVFRQLPGHDTLNLDYAHSPDKAKMKHVLPDKQWLCIDVNEQAKHLAGHYGLIFSLHCRQIFPPKLVEQTRCINIHPGYNPWNRGWFPHVFAIATGTPAGATIHEMDARVDAGPIIARQEVAINPDDTSGSLYPRILEAEKKLLESYLPAILQDDYDNYIPEEKGSYHSKQDYENLCRIRPGEQATNEKLIRRLRALSHGDYNNAYIDQEGDKIFLRIQLKNS